MKVTQSVRTVLMYVWHVSRLPQIDVCEDGAGEPLAFPVVVRDGGGETCHRVTLAKSEYERLTDGAHPQVLVEAAFRFLLDREPKEAILAEFDFAVIGHYFSDFERKLPAYLSNRHLAGVHRMP